MTDFEMFDTYRRNNTRCNGHNDYCDVNYLLRFWRDAKNEYLASMFENKFIMERAIEYIRPEEELSRDMCDFIEENHDLMYKLSGALQVAMNIEDYWRNNDLPTQVYHTLRGYLFNSHNMIENRVGIIGYDELHDKEIISYTLEINGNKIVVQSGMKITRLWGQIAKALNMTDIWEQIRIGHSQMLNQKKLKGTLCLSIHPLDYATASDNDNGWSSCMSWQDQGCYRLGTVEMMNSPMVICAYVKSDKQKMEIAGKEWGSKKWRAWIIVTPDVIVCNRHYPYHQKVFAEQAIEWVRDLVKVKYGWTYEDIHHDFFDYMSQENMDIEFRTNYMYNDFGGDDVIGCFRTNFHDGAMPKIINFSGKAECMVCGREIGTSEQNADALECSDCFTEAYCDRCGEALDQDYVFYGPDGEPLCESCYNEICTTCTCCEDTIYTDDAIQVGLPVYYERAKQFITAHPSIRQHFVNWHGSLRIPSIVGGESICLCEHCASKFDLHDVEYGPEDDVQVDLLTVPNPNKTSMDDMLRMLDANDYVWAKSYRNQKNAQQECNEIIEFWTDQWNTFKEEFNSVPDET